MRGKFLPIYMMRILLVVGFALGTISGMAYAQNGTPTAVEQVAGSTAAQSGWFSMIWGDSLEGASRLVYTLTNAGGQTAELALDESLAQPLGGVLALNGKYVSVQGHWVTPLSPQSTSNILSVSELTLAAAPDSFAAGAATDAPAVVGSKPWISLMCKFSDVSTEPHDLAFFQGMYGSSKPGLDHYWRELSYDTANVAGSGAVGWFVLPYPESHYNPTDTTGGTGSSGRNALAADCTGAADASVDFSLYSGINMMFNSDFDNGYAWGGGRYMTLDGVSKVWSTTWEPPWGYADVSVIAHEMGHGFGLPHSCWAAWNASSNDYVCSTAYNNAWDVMSKDRYNCAASRDTTYGCLAQHTIAYYKDRLGWIPADQKFTPTAGTSTSITMEQLAQPTNGNYKLAQISINGVSTHFYTVEVRRLTGYDVKVAGAAVILHEVKTSWPEPAHVVDVDLNGVTSDAGAMWTVGETFTDAAAGISVSVLSATATGFQVTITKSGYVISGNAGVAGATLGYTDGTAQTATADGAGLYSFPVSYGWSGTVTVSKPGYTFSPASKTYTNVAADMPNENYTATAITYTLSGSTGLAGTTLSYTDGTAKTATADGTGAYSFTVSYNWSGTVTPSRPGYSFLPVSRTYTNVLSNRTGENYTGTAITYVISGNVGVAGATLGYTDGTAKTATADGAGAYSFLVSYNWSGTVIPTKTGYTFAPVSKTYTNVLSNRSGENYTATAITFTISGNAGAAGVMLSYTDGTAKTATADGAGLYSLVVSYGWTGTVTPSLTNYTFSPASRSYSGVVTSRSTENYTASYIDSYEPDNVAGQAKVITDGVAQVHSITPAGDVDWVKFTLSAASTVTLETSGPAGGDTIMSLYASSNLSVPITMNDDKNAAAGNLYSYIEYACPAALSAGTYYVKVVAFSASAQMNLYNLAFNTTRTCTISGNAGIAAAVLSYTDGTAKTATADGAGNYAFQVPYNWSGMVIPAKLGYVFTPASRSYTNVTATRSGENYSVAGITYTISGNTGVGGTTLSYTDVTAKTATADGNGAYAFQVSENWSGTVTPSKVGYTFAPTSRTYTTVAANHSGENYTPTAITYTISGNAGVGGAVLGYFDGVNKTVTADGAGAYTFQVPYNWSGVVTPTKIGYVFTPASKTYANVLVNKTSENYGAVAVFYTITGNAGSAGVTLGYTDGTAKTATADGVGLYSFQVPHGWSGTVTPSKVGYTFAPVNRTYSNVTANKPSENYTAAPVTFVISGSAGVAGAVLSYTDGTAKTATADGAGLYSFQVSYNWSGTVTPAKPGYTFTPVNRTYANLLASLTGENYTVAVIPLTISGNAGVAGATLSYMDGTAKTVTADAAGLYSFQVPYGWSGTVTPTRARYVFTPVSKTYTNLTTHQTGQDFSAAPSAAFYIFVPRTIR